MNSPSPTDLLTIKTDVFNRKLHEAADVHPTGITTDASKGMTIHLDAGNTPIEFSVTDEGIQITNREWRIISNLKRQRRSHHHKNLDKIGAPIETLVAHNLPLYWNQSWLEEKHAELGTYGAIAKLYKREVQGANPSSIANFARDTFGLSPRDQLLENRNRFVNEYEELHERVPQASFAKKYNVTVSTINRWVRDAHRAYAAMVANPELVKNKQEVAKFAQDHNLLPTTINMWKRRGSELYSQEFTTQPKAHYHGRDEYARIREHFYALYEKAHGEINQSAVAAQLGVDRSTVQTWIKKHEETVQYPTLDRFNTTSASNETN